MKSTATWYKYRKQRNLVTKLKRESLKGYFAKECNQQPNTSTSFWNVVKPFVSNKGHLQMQDISLFEGNEVVTDRTKICNLFNDHFVNIASDRCESHDLSNKTVADVIDYYNEHRSIKVIKASEHRRPIVGDFVFNPVSPGNVLSKLKQLNTRKACGYDYIPAKLLKLGAPAIHISLTSIINFSIESSIYPNDNKKAEISPLYKKNDNLVKTNYRPLSILTSLSKITEGLLCDQLSSDMSDILSRHLSAYRKNYSCNNVLIKCVEGFRKALDDGNYVGCILLDLSNAFDAIPHGLLIAKLNAYGVSVNACSYVMNYLTDRKQRVKIAHQRSDWVQMKRDVPQGSLAGPLLFNICINDYILHIENICGIYNYADDNTLSCVSKDPCEIQRTLEHALNVSLKWFDDNFMIANPTKFQAMLLGPDDIEIKINVHGKTIEMQHSVKLLGIQIDNKLTFNHHVSNVCKKAGNQINIMKRLGKLLDNDCRLKIYDSFFLSNFNYCPLVYSLQSSKSNNKIETLNKRMLRVVCNDKTLNYNELLSRICRPMLYCNRKKVLAELVFKVLNGLSPPVSPDFFTRQITTYDLRDNNILVQPRFRTIRYGFKSIAYQGALIWNALPHHIKTIAQYKCFKNALSKFNFDDCKCGVCFTCTFV